jgi:hypothetical protein
VCVCARACVCVCTFCRCIRVIVCIRIIRWWIDHGFRRRVFQELVDSCAPLLNVTLSACYCALHILDLGCDSRWLHVAVLSTFISWPWGKHYSVNCVSLRGVTGLRNFTEFAKVFRRYVRTQRISWWWDPWCSSVLVVTKKKPEFREIQSVYTLRLLPLGKNVYFHSIRMLPGRHQLSVVTVCSISGARPFSVVIQWRMSRDQAYVALDWGCWRKDIDENLFPWERN